MTDKKKRDSRPEDTKSDAEADGAVAADEGSEEELEETGGPAESDGVERDAPDDSGDDAGRGDDTDAADGGAGRSAQEAAAEALAQALESLEAAGVGLSGEQGSSGPGEIVRAFEQTPKNLFVLPLVRAVPFPGLMMPVQLGTNRAQQVVQRANDGGGFVILLTRRSATTEDVEADGEELGQPMPTDDEAPLDPAAFHDVGVVAKILRTFHLPDGSQAAMLQGLRRVRVKKVVRRSPFLIVHTEDMLDIPGDPKRVEAQVHAVRNLLKQIVDRSPQFGDEFAAAAFNIDDAGHLADFCASYLFRKIGKRQEVLEIQDIGARLDAVALELTRELGVLELSARIQQEIRDKIEKAQREYFLREQMKIIRRELGEEVDAREAELARLRTSVDEAGLPPAALAKAKEELERLEVTPVESPEHSVVRNHLDWLVSLPWSKSSKDRKDISVAATVLDEDHYGLAEVKERVL
ncbi:MAG: LON peptidase substrate-binding domain-containing protein, partial [Planctomycetes bacterium]|nr:LON peptidase substrate-binding domain-containing protein [Planctomycetota bacterium]